ncbi:hypothetical protein IX51_02815 [uncultured archaeon]|nr:hypothetical protein IX51_02815 [uncultured archaeon]
MLRRLGKWLRMMGFDVEYPEKGISDSEIIESCKKESRILLTRDQELYARFPRSILIRSEDFKDQVLQFIEQFPPDEQKYFTRCTECNGILGKSGKPGPVAGVPDSVKSSGKDIWVCSKCGKVYWHGSHYYRILQQIRKFEEEIK